MIGPSSLLILCVLAATSGESTVIQISHESSSIRSAVKDRTVFREPQSFASIAGEPNKLPSDASEEGIPGLPAVEGKEPKPATNSKPKESLQKPTSKAPPVQEKQEEPGEFSCTDEPAEAPAPLFLDEQAIHSEPIFEQSTCRGRSHWLSDVCWDGWIDQGVTINTLSPRNRSNGTVTFNNRSNEYQMNQAYTYLHRDINPELDCWQVGGRIDLLYGTDSYFTTARGLETFDDGSQKWNAQQYGLAMPQLFMETYIPWGTGVSMKFGHFYAPLGYESVMGPDNFFYSHSYTFQYGEPFTFTGLLGTTKLGDLTVRAGLNRGWDNWEDTNNDLGFVGGVDWTSESQRTTISLNVTAGREQPDPSSNIQTLYSLVIQQKLGERLQYVIQHDYGNNPNAGIDRTDACWYGINQYLLYTMTEAWKAGMRIEWFRDQGGTRVPMGLQTADYYELTAGLNYSPNQRLLVRPEIRWDWTSTPGCHPFGDGTMSSQVILDCDVIVKF